MLLPNLEKNLSNVLNVKEMSFNILHKYVFEVQEPSQGPSIVLKDML
jgi:hypothetical protein